MKEIKTYRFTYRLYGEFRSTATYLTRREAMREMWPIIEKFDGKWLAMTLVIESTWVKDDTEQQ